MAAMDQQPDDKATNEKVNASPKSSHALEHRRQSDPSSLLAAKTRPTDITSMRAITFDHPRVIDTTTTEDPNNDNLTEDGLRGPYSELEYSQGEKRRIRRRRSDVQSDRKKPQRQQSLPSSHPTSKTWQALRAGIRLKASKKGGDFLSKTPAGIDLITELQMGVLPAQLVKLYLERDEHGNMRIPVLLNHLKLKFTDSSNFAHRQHATFRIELDYGDGTMKWVIERELRDFVKLHARYRLALLRQGINDLMPNFPKTSIPAIGYFRPERTNSNMSELDLTEKVEQDRPDQRQQSPIEMTEKPEEQQNTSKRPVPTRKSTAVATRRAEFARLQREVMENYLIKLIRVMMYRPEANRLCHFLELSALGVELAIEGGYQGKEGYLIIRSRSDRFAASCTPLGLWNRFGPKWFLVRQSYIFCVDSPDQTKIHDLMLVDSAFQIIRPSKITGAISSSSNNKASESSSHHNFYIKNSERQLKLLAKNERQMDQFIASIEKMQSETPWAQANRFDSFAPARMNVAAKWLVDGRDYFWNVSRAIAMAKEVIYIHDWWLSPELYLRRPPALHEDWRLDRLLKTKAEQGVKIYVILYKEVGSTVPVDSTYSKNTLLNLHPNIFVQRSPDHIRTGTFFWAHHEKVCCIDGIIAFCGGIDLCFGRWDTQRHILVDNKPLRPEKLSELEDIENMRVWPGKDYSNPRVLDFHTLNQPDVDMYNRDRVPRMPWHDIGMQILGQPARDLSRHFVQRWNYLLRHKNPSRPTPFLLPPAEFTPSQLANLGLTGTCEVQILRSACPWSLGTPDRTEHSIQNAYLKCIEKSLHFVYIENQFFITSTTLDNDIVIENNIGNALVSRIKRAYRADTHWRAVIVIPLVPGFEFPIDHSDGTSIRLIMHAQYRSICRGETSIFSKLRAEGIEPSDYISFYGLRNWGKLADGQYVTEQSYIHAKTMIVDDRIAIIGSANINERSQRGNRDSEIASIIRDTDMLPSRMAGEPFEVGRFAHTLRLRLMREHLGVDVDEIEEKDTLVERKKDAAQEQAAADAPPSKKRQHPKLADIVGQFVGGGQSSTNVKQSNGDAQTTSGPTVTEDRKVHAEDEMRNEMRIKHDTEINQPTDKDEQTAKVETREQNGNVPRIDTDIGDTHKRTESSATDIDPNLMSPSGHAGRSRSGSNVSVSSNFSVLGRKSRRKKGAGVRPIPEPPAIHPEAFIDPLDDEFYEDVWHTIASSNTEIFRRVFRCVPDDLVTTWKEYKDYMAAAQALNPSTVCNTAANCKDPNPPPGWASDDDRPMEVPPTSPASPSSLGGSSNADGIENVMNGEPTAESEIEKVRTHTSQPSASSRRKSFVDPSMLVERGEMAELLRKVRGTLVIWPTRFMEQEDAKKLFLFSMDRLLPQDIYI